MIRFTWSIYALSASALALGMAAGCGGDDHFDPLGQTDGGGPRPDGGPRVDGGPGDIDAGGTPDAPVDSLGPNIAIISPTEPAAGDFTSDAIVVDDRVVVTCEVSRNADTNTPIDSASVVISASQGGHSVEEPAAPASAADQYVATLDLSSFHNGRIEIRCTGSDLADEPRTNTAAIDDFLDLGPLIEIFSPVTDQSYGQQLDITFTVTESPVANGDPFAEVAGVTVTVAGIEVDVEPTGGGSYFGTVVFDDPEFVPSLSGDIEIQIEATNSRTDSPVASLRRRTFVADINGPVIEVTSPDAGDVIGGFVTIAAKIDDNAGVATVLARIAHQFEIELEPAGGTTYSAVFDTRLLPTFFVFPLIEVVALDAVGNETGVGRVVTLDNRPPLVDLDPAKMRNYFCIQPEDQVDPVSCVPAFGDALTCTLAYDPAGSDASDDGETVGQLNELRARIEDQGNGPLTPPDGVLIPHAGVDEDNVLIYVLDDSDGALLVDLDDDGICDDINPAITPTSFPTSTNEAAVASMVDLSPTGSMMFPSALDETGTTPGLEDFGCVPPEADIGTVPDPVCDTTPSTIIIEANDGSNAIYTLPPVVGESCMGNAFDAPASNISDGWACVAVRAQDKLGNVRVSPPHRLCIDFDGDGTDGVDGAGTPLDALGCAALGEVADEGVRPSCTDGCAPATSFGDIPAYQLRHDDTQ